MDDGLLLHGGLHGDVHGLGRLPLGVRSAQVLPEIVHGGVFLAALQTLEGVLHLMDVLAVVDQVHLLRKRARTGLALVWLGTFVGLH